MGRNAYLYNIIILSYGDCFEKSIFYGVPCIAFVDAGIRRESWIRINQQGYLPQSVKTAVFISEEKNDAGEFELVEVLTMRPVAKFRTVANTGKYGTKESTCRLNFTSFEQQGSYCLKVGDTYSPAFGSASTYFCDYFYNKDRFSCAGCRWSRVPWHVCGCFLHACAQHGFGCVFVLLVAPLLFHGRPGNRIKRKKEKSADE